MKKLLLGIAVVAAFAVGATQFGWLFESDFTAANGNARIASAFREQTSGIQVSSEGVVTKLLPDDRKGVPHQKFVVMLPTSQTLLIAHNIKLAPRISSLRVGDVVGFCGVYEWNRQGGVVHWTHRDPSGWHRAGWLRHRGRIYQ